jgi:hypothetical protein
MQVQVTDGNALAQQDRKHERGANMQAIDVDRAHVRRPVVLVLKQRLEGAMQIEAASHDGEDVDGTRIGANPIPDPIDVFEGDGAKGRLSEQGRLGALGTGGRAIHEPRA